MALDLGELSVRLSAEDQLSGALEGAQQAARRTDDITRQAAQGVSASTRQMATQYQQLSREASTYATAARTAHSKAETAVDSARVAQERLDAAQRDSTTSAEQLDRAQRQVADATAEAERAVRNSEQANDRMVASHRRAARAAEAGGRDAERAMQGVEDAMREAARTAATQGEQAGSGFSDRFQGGLDSISGAAEGAGGSTGGSFIAGFAPRVSGLASKGGPIGIALGGMAVLGIAAGAVLADAIADGMQIQQKTANVQAALGVDDEQMAKLGKAAGDSYVRAFGTSVEGNLDTGAALMEFGIIGGDAQATEIQKAIEQVEVLNGILKTETPESLRAVNGLIKSGLVDDLTQAGDLIVAAKQAGVDAQGDLIDSLSEYSAGWEQTGFSAKFALALVDQSMENGVDNSDRASDAVREFGRRIYENADEQKEVYRELGLDAEAMYDTFVKGGPEAEAAFDLVFDAIRALEDPTERAALAQQLLGDTAGDFIKAYTEWDPSAAVAKFGEVNGELQRASDIMGSTSAAAMESAMRGIETAGNDVKLALADAFSPLITDVSQWVAGNRGELIQFFTDAASGALDMGGTIAEVGGTVIRILAGISDVTNDIPVAFANAFAGIAETAASVADIIPGLGGQADGLRDAAAAARSYAEQTDKMPDQLRDLADMAEAAGPKLHEMADSVKEAGTQAADSAKLATALGEAIFEVPDDKTITIDSNTFEKQRELEELGLKTKQLPDGKFEVTANTDEGQRIIDSFVKANDGRKIEMFTFNHMTEVQASAARSYSTSGAGGQVPMADGGFLPDQAEIRPGSGDGVVQRVRWAEGETGKEGFVPMALSKRPRSVQILQQIADEFGYGLVQMADGGFVSTQDLDSFSRGIEGETYVFGGWDGTWATDCSGAASRVTNYATTGDPDSLGRFATGNEGEALTARGFQDGYQEGALNAGWLNGGPGGGHTSITLPNGVSVEMGGNRGDGQYGGQARAASTFPNVMHLPMQGNPDPGSFDAGAVGNFNAPPASSSSGTVPGPLSGSMSAGSLTTSSGPIDVRVTNFADLSGGALPDGRQPKMVGNLKVFANGGIETQNPEIATTGGPVRVWAEPQAGPWESYIPGDPSKRARAIDIWRETGKRLNVSEFADGGMAGFGGYTDPKPRDYMAPTNLYEAAALATGLGFTAVSGLANYISMAQSGTVDLSNLAPQFDTGSNDIPGMSEGFSAVVQQLEEVVKTLQAGGMLTADVNVDTSNGAVGLNLMKTGLA